MRSVDVMLCLPSLLVMLLLVTGIGTSDAVLIFGVVLVLCPGVARIVRTATLEVSESGYVEAAVSRGERTGVVLGSEILPNIVSPIMAELGIRFSYSIILISSVNLPRPRSSTSGGELGADDRGESGHHLDEHLVCVRACAAARPADRRREPGRGRVRAQPRTIGGVVAGEQVGIGPGAPRPSGHAG